MRHGKNSRHMRKKHPHHSQRSTPSFHVGEQFRSQSENVESNLMDHPHSLTSGIPYKLPYVLRNLIPHSAKHGKTSLFIPLGVGRIIEAPMQR